MLKSSCLQVLCWLVCSMGQLLETNTQQPQPFVHYITSYQTVWMTVDHSLSQSNSETPSPRQKTVCCQLFSKENELKQKETDPRIIKDVKTKSAYSLATIFTQLNTLNEWQTLGFAFKSSSPPQLLPFFLSLLFLVPLAPWCSFTASRGFTVSEPSPPISPFHFNTATLALEQKDSVRKEL